MREWMGRRGWLPVHTQQASRSLLALRPGEVAWVGAAWMGALLPKAAVNSLAQSKSSEQNGAGKSTTFCLSNCPQLTHS